MTRRVLLRCCGLLALAPAACRPAPMVDVAHSEAPPPVFGERDPARITKVIHEDLPPIERSDCPAEVADYPVPYFGDRVLIRLPSGVSEDSFVEFMPYFARSTGPVETDFFCHAAPAPVIEYMAMTLFDLDPDKPIEQFRDEVLEAYGYPEGTTLVAHDPGRDAYSGKWVLDIPATESNQYPARALFAIVSGYGIVVTIVYEVHPGSWSLIVNTLLESADRISLLPE